MKKPRLVVLGITAVTLLYSAACHKAAVIGTQPAPAPVPVATQTPRPAPAQNRTVASTPARETSRPAAQPNRSATLPPQTRKRLEDELARLNDALFDFDKDTIRPDASVVLRDDVGVIRSILADYPAQKLTIEGHCDERGSAEYNLALGDRRANAVHDFLTNMGIPGAQLTVISYGKEKPVCTQENEDCWQKNRRAHVTAAP
jgi:peptidoglycan-associated lipoprotein